MKSKIVYLDGVRGLAACIVVISHFFQVFLPSVFEGKPEIAHFAFEAAAAQTPINLLFNGNFSVCLFFVLSGYVLSYRYFQTADRLHVCSSAARRYFRLAVPALLSVVVAYLAILAGFGFYDDIQGITLSSMPDPFAADTSAWVMIKESLFDTFFTYGSEYNPVLWTMTYELFGSFLIFAFLLLLGKRKLRFAVYALLIWHWIDSYYLGFVLGMLLSDLKHSGRNWLAALNRPWIIAVFVIAGIYLGSYPYWAPQGTIYSILVWEAPGFSFFEFYHVIGSFLILTALLNPGPMQTLFNRKPFAYLGKISFSLYLVHLTIICSLGSYIFLQLHSALPYGMSVLLTMLMTLPVIFAAAHLFERFVDAKTLTLLSRWSEQLFGPARRRSRERAVQRERTAGMD
ncbi:acyltransferase [Paenibacillus dendritiformis]|uniref:acyltransferase family protein n=1 Tax=Paenibacillus dendritiformis TaxID=130049 RepID=UPI00143D6F8A|nr:acyltransferase [Paenibacillus dendritiformis]NKI22956.1 acyltransferase [Paenibacillus dendritiformis]NRG01192.1 acyltransferase [Paenibacillus dendritiformis]